MKKKEAKGIIADLKLLILESDLNKIKKSKNPERSKVFKQYSGLLLNIIKNIEVPNETQESKHFETIEDIEKFNG